MLAIMCTTVAKHASNTWYLMKTRDPVSWMRYEDEIALFDKPQDKFRKLIIQNPISYEDGYYGGINEVGVAFISTFVRTSEDQVSYIRKPYIRLILDAGTAKEAVEIIKSFNPKIGGNMFVADPMECYGIEGTASECLVEQVKESAVKANHFCNLPARNINFDNNPSFEPWSKTHEERAGELVVTMSDTVVQQFLRPWLTEQFQQLGYDGQDRTRGGIPLDTERLVAGLRQHFESYPEWMAERVVRTEARIALNQAAFGVWEDAGIEELIAIDGLGGRTGKTDATCLARNGRTFSLDEARAEDALEHPNGTLFWVPSMVAVTESRPAARPQAASLLASGPYTLRSGALRARRRFWI